MRYIEATSAISLLFRATGRSAYRLAQTHPICHDATIRILVNHASCTTVKELLSTH